MLFHKLPGGGVVELVPTLEEDEAKIVSAPYASISLCGLRSELFAHIPMLRVVVGAGLDPQGARADEPHYPRVPQQSKSIHEAKIARPLQLITLVPPLLDAEIAA